MSMLNIPDIRLLARQWSKKNTKDNILSTFFDELSNNNDKLPSVANAKAMKIPQEALHYVGAEHDGKSFNVTVPLLEALLEEGKGGLQIAEGSGEAQNAAYAEVWYNISRKVTKIDDVGVESNATQYIKAAQDSHGAIMNWFREDKDYSCQRAIVEGADRYLTEDEYWKDYPNLVGHQPKKIIATNIAFKGMTSAITGRNLEDKATYNYAADLTVVATALNSGLSNTSVFDVTALEGAIDFASNFKPLNYRSGNDKVNYVMLLSKMQSRQLRQDPNWKTLMSNAEKRGLDNRALSGVLGVYQGVLLIEDLRSPIFKLTSATAGEFQYVTPKAAHTFDYMRGLGSLGRAIKENGTGSLEIARILGAGAIGCPKVGDIRFESETKDFNFAKELCGIVERGFNRLDFQSTKGIKNISSGLYFTSTTAINF